MGFKLTPEEKISRAIIDLQEKNPFFAHLTFGLRFIPMEEGCPTMGVNARGECAYNPVWVDGLKRDELAGVLCHEVMHVALDHLSRMGNRRLRVANIAMDMSVNHIVKSNNMKLPDGVVPVDMIRDSSTIKVMTKKGAVKTVVVERISERFWEDIYSQLSKEMEDEEGKEGDGTGDGTRGGSESGNGRGDGNGSGGTREGLSGDYKNADGHRWGDASEMTEEEREKIREQWAMRVAQGITAAKQRGVLPAGMGRYIDRLLKPKVRWKDLLRSMIKPFITPVDYSYNKPHKKSKACGVFLPSVRKEHMEVEVLCDTSGSIGQDELSEFLSEIVGIASSSGHVKMWVSFCDTEISSRYEISNGNIGKILAMKVTGGGGTSMENGLDEIKKRNPRVPVVVVLTDGCDSYARKKRDYPFDVIWCISKNGVSLENHEAKYGMKVKID